MTEAGGKGKGSGICVCGEALIDFLPCATSSGEEAFRGVCGGSPFNCCVAAQRLGMPVSFLGVIANDLFGEKLYKHLEKEGVDMSLTLRADRPTTLAFVVRSPGEGEKYAFFKENSADSSLSASDVQAALGKRDFEAVHMSLGAVTLEHAGCAEAFAELFRLAGNCAGTLRTFDPNLRPNMISGGAEPYSKKVERLLCNVDVVKTSDDDMEFLYGKGSDLNKHVASWLQMGPRLVVLTRGAKGAEAYVLKPGSESPTSVTAAPPGQRPNTVDATGQSCPVVDTVGAGDTFMGGLIAGCLGKGGACVSLVPQLVQKEPWTDDSLTRLKEVMSRAALGAAVTCSRAGADPPKAEEVETAYLAVTKG